MVPWGLILSGAAWAMFPQHKGVILAVGAATSVMRIKRRQDCAFALPPGEPNAAAKEGSNPNNAGGDSVADGDDEGYSEAGIRMVRLEWENISCELKKRQKGEVSTKKILDNISGKAFPGQLLAILGPSGSGKTTLLSALAGQVAKSENLGLTGSLKVNGKKNGTSTHRQAFVRQDDIFYSQLTVRETLMMAAKLQLPRTMTEEEKERHIESLMQHLGLTGVADTIVGDEKTRGISGGERKRLSIACELIAAPSVVFADEPTTGLDAFQAKTVMEALRGLARDGHTVICSIHQPRGAIYDMFDDVILLASGQVVYAGAANDDAIAYFSALGYECPTHFNPAEFFSDLISVDYSSPAKEEESKKRLQKLVAAFRAQGCSYVEPSSSRTENPYTVTGGKRNGNGNGNGLALTRDLESPGRNEPGSSWWVQFKLLMIRSWRQVTRDKATNIIRGMMTGTSALIFGAIFWQMGLKQTAIQDRMGLLQVAAINTAMASLTKTVNSFPRERSVVNRERVRGGYGMIPYFLSKIVAEMPVSALFPLGFSVLVYPMTGLHRSFTRFLCFLSIVTLESFTSSALGLAVGAVAPSTEAALALGPMVMLIFIVFGGYYVNSGNTPKIFQWLPNISLIKWGFEAMCINEFTGLTFDAKEPTDVRRGEQVLERLSFDKTTLTGALCSEARIMGSFYLLTLFILSKNKPRFQPLVDAPVSSSSVNTESFPEPLQDDMTVTSTPILTREFTLPITAAPADASTSLFAAVGVFAALPDADVPSPVPADAVPASVPDGSAAAPAPSPPPAPAPTAASSTPAATAAPATAPSSFSTDSVSASVPAAPTVASTPGSASSPAPAPAPDAVAPAVESIATGNLPIQSAYGTVSTDSASADGAQQLNQAGESIPNVTVPPEPTPQGSPPPPPATVATAATPVSATNSTSQALSTSAADQTAQAPTSSDTSAGGLPVDASGGQAPIGSKPVETVISSATALPTVSPDTPVVKQGLADAVSITSVPSSPATISNGVQQSGTA
ncbi:hypothetical protein CBR_g57867 [Chara braunii]|uniref:ABC transporter domain-containing protein n=1 Tax=Chara braunii TaxID=69332 RepID=A0A388K8C4_CHABU|nr:hypothetical protein CBR_g57867 [Chara braunii]|eukprot:GBG66269.1 hypothetical protein CBR_g57867 [Chara braunii]